MTGVRRSHPTTNQLRIQGTSIADALLELYFDPAAKEMQHIGSYELPAREAIDSVIEMCRSLMFPGYAGPEVGRLSRRELRELVRTRIAELRVTLQREIYRALHHHRQQSREQAEIDSEETALLADDIADRFLATLPSLRQTVRLDLRYAFESDPAAMGIDEILLCYPGVYATTVYRIAHALLREGSVLLPRMMTEVAHHKTGIDIHPGAQIGNAFFIDHGTGVVIGETTVIGNRVRIYQGVTLGALIVPQGEARPEPGHRRHPTLEDDVVVYANATILGGKTVIGKGAVIGGNAFVTTSVEPGAKVSGSVRAQR